MAYNFSNLISEMDSAQQNLPDYMCKVNFHDRMRILKISFFGRKKMRDI